MRKCVLECCFNFGLDLIGRLFSILSRSKVQRIRLALTRTNMTVMEVLLQYNYFVAQCVYKTVQRNLAQTNVLFRLLHVLKCVFGDVVLLLS